MDVAYFLRQRTQFVRFNYDEGIKPFAEIKRKIENEDPPFVSGYFDPETDSAEPPFLEEWMDADAGAQFLGLACISMLSDTLKIYFRTIQEEIGFIPDDAEERLMRRSFVAGYKACLAEILSDDWSDCPVDFDMIEQVVLARNSGQHGDHIATMRARFTEDTLKKHPRPYFVSATERAMLDASRGAVPGWQMPTIHIDRNRLFSAIDEVEKLADWIAARDDQVRQWRSKVAVQKPSIDDRHLALRLSSDAAAYLHAARLVLSGGPSGIEHELLMHQPVNFLLCHAAELTLKAYLKLHGEAKYGRDKHSLTGLLTRARRHRLRVGDDFARYAETMAPAHGNSQFRYAQPESFPWVRAGAALAMIAPQLEIIHQEIIRSAQDAAGEDSDH